MKHYFFNKNADDKKRHEVHTEDCSFIPAPHNRTYIGYCSDCFEAIEKAENDNPSMSFDGCFYCCNPCNKG